MLRTSLLAAEEASRCNPREGSAPGGVEAKNAAPEQTSVTSALQEPSRQVAGAVQEPELRVVKGQHASEAAARGAWPSVERQNAGRSDATLRRTESLPLCGSFAAAQRAFVMRASLRRQASLTMLPPCRGTRPTPLPQWTSLRRAPCARSTRRRSPCTARPRRQGR